MAKNKTKKKKSSNRPPSQRSGLKYNASSANKKNKKRRRSRKKKIYASGIYSLEYMRDSGNRKRRFMYMCRNWARDNECRDGKHCSFAHGLEELHPNSNYRTQYCNYGEDCLRGRACKFAHSPRELRVKRAKFEKPQPTGEELQVLLG